MTLKSSLFQEFRRFKGFEAGRTLLSPATPLGTPGAHSYFSRFFLASFKAASGVASPFVAVS
ncbi:MAG: hypothetical protein WA376_01200, partial [Terrimicrobiaceae bacterium]